MAEGMEWNGDEVTRMVTGAVAEYTEQAAQIVFDRAQALCPVDTKRLRNSGEIRDGGDQFTELGAADATKTVVYDTPYASFVHDGTSLHPPNPWLAKAVIQTRPEVMALWRSIFGD